MPSLAISKDWIKDVSLLGFAIFIFYLFWLGSYPLFTPDEGRYSEVAREMVASGDFITPRVNGIAFLDKPILYYWLQAIAISLFGLKEWALRFFPVCFGVFGAIITYIAGRSLFDRRTGILAALILALSPLYFGGAHYANLDLEVAVFLSSALLFFLIGTTKTGKIKTYCFLAFYLCAAFATLTKGLIGIVFPVAIIGTWIILLKRFQLLKEMHLFLGLSIFCIVVLPWYYLAHKANPEFLHFFFITQHLTRFLSLGEFNNQTPFWFYLPIVLAGFFPWTIFLYHSLIYSLQVVWKEREKHAKQLFLLLWVFIIFGFFSIPHSKIIGYIIPIFPALALLIAHFISSGWKSVSPGVMRQICLNYMVMGSIVFLLLLVLPFYQWIPFSASFIPYLATIALIALASSISAFFLMKRNKLSYLFLLCLLSSALLLFTLTMGASHLNQNSAKSLVVYLKTILKPEDAVISYFKYYQDVPLYLEKRIIIAANWNSNSAKRDNWMRELWLGMPFQKTDDYLINEEDFWKRFRGQQRVFVFLNENYFSQFKAQAGSYFHLGRENDIILLSNQPTIMH